MEVDASINIGIDDDEIVEAIKPKLERIVWRLIKDEFGDMDSTISSWMDNAPLHDYMDWDSAHRSGLMTFEHTDDEVRSLIREIIEHNHDVLRPIITAQVDQAILRTVRDTVRYEVRPIVREVLTEWIQSLGNVFTNMTHEYKTRENTSE